MSQQSSQLLRTRHDHAPQHKTNAPFCRMPSSRTPHTPTPTHPTHPHYTHTRTSRSSYVGESRGSCGAEPEVLLATHGERQQSPRLSPLHRIMRIHPQRDPLDYGRLPITFTRRQHANPIHCISNSFWLIAINVTTSRRLFRARRRPKAPSPKSRGR